MRPRGRYDELGPGAAGRVSNPGPASALSAADASARRRARGHESNSRRRARGTAGRLVMSATGRRSVHIGLLAPPWIPVPPPAYGGIERVVAVQAAGLAAAGHDVTLCAAPGSAVEGVRVIEPLDLLPVQIGTATDEWCHVLAAMEALADQDVVVDHSGPLGALLSAQGPVPSMHVVHGSLEGELLGIYEGLAKRAPGLRHLRAARQFWRPTEERSGRSCSTG
ncbi:glycosyltransferase [Pseudonocardia sp. TRM90224]|uniref:glycosyltransferase n=1 Tax=Pseudonocardia sp. TRM90224 TaxID=2812678 RepID=UPI0027E1CDBB|nr:glycosyltransferase [Pseudonocardia sp. TRM90224]